MATGAVGERSEPPPPEESAERGWLDEITIPAELIWTNIDLAGLQLIPVQTAEHNVAILSEHVKILPDKLDYIEIDQPPSAGSVTGFWHPRKHRASFRCKRASLITPFSLRRRAIRRGWVNHNLRWFARTIALCHPIGQS